MVNAKNVLQNVNFVKLLTISYNALNVFKIISLTFKENAYYAHYNTVNSAIYLMAMRIHLKEILKYKC